MPKDLEQLIKCTKSTIKVPGTCTISKCKDEITHKIFIIYPHSETFGSDKKNVDPDSTS